MWQDPPVEQHVSSQCLGVKVKCKWSDTLLLCTIIIMLGHLVFQLIMEQVQTSAAI
jgi:hypothetical protein